MRAIISPAGILRIGDERFRAAIGRSGITADKHEGDGASPIGALPLRQVLYRPDRLDAPLCEVPVRALHPADGWCDDPTHAAYNKQVRLPLDGTAETLWRDDAVYDVIGVLGWNDQPVRAGRGSAIFLHVARPDFSPTDGCVALALGDLLRVLAVGLKTLVIVRQVPSD